MKRKDGKITLDVLVIGLGSMGKRRIRLLKRLMEEWQDEKGTIAGVDGMADRQKEAEEELSIQTYASVADALADGKYDAAVISTSPLSHAELIRECLEYGMHVFTEINLVADGYEENIRLARAKGKVLFLSSTPMYRKEMGYIKQYAAEGALGQYRYHIGQYLPEWHPWENYKDFFVRDARTNGCREIFAIELPWMADTFGDIVRMRSFHKKVSGLAIPYDDSYTVILEHASGVIGNLSVDIVTPKAGREFEFWGEGRYVEWKGTPDSLYAYDAKEKDLAQVRLYEAYEHKDGYHQFVVENAYYDELANFFGSVGGTEEPRHTFEKDKKILQLIDEIEGK